MFSIEIERKFCNETKAFCSVVNQTVPVFLGHLVVPGENKIHIQNTLLICCFEWTIPL